MIWSSGLFLECDLCRCLRTYMWIVWSLALSSSLHRSYFFMKFFFNFCTSIYYIIFHFKNNFKKYVDGVIFQYFFITNWRVSFAWCGTWRLINAIFFIYIDVLFSPHCALKEALETRDKSTKSRMETSKALKLNMATSKISWVAVFKAH